MTTNKARIIAFYLPQFHPIPENDKWWGKGFTEWTNVGKAKSLFRGHYQPRVPADLGYYDLRVPETRKAQADLARSYGIEGFCYWHYWFGNGKRLLERPFNEVLESGDPDFPFCLAWANESWKGFAHGLVNRNVLIEQEYLGIDDYVKHFYSVLPAFKDHRYIKVDGKPLFMIYKPLATSEISLFIETWRKLAIKNGLPGIHFVAHSSDVRESLDTIMNMGFDAINVLRLRNYLHIKRSNLHKLYDKVNNQFFHRPTAYSYARVAKYFCNYEVDKNEHIYPSLISGWDHTPRSGYHGLVLTDFSPKEFAKHMAEVLKSVESKEEEHRIIFLKSWNEWAEGNYVEPDLKYGTQFLEVIKQHI